MKRMRHGTQSIATLSLLVLVIAIVLLSITGCGAKKEKTKEEKPEYVLAEIYCGRNIPGGGEVTEEQFARFLTDVVTPEFPLGMTVYDAYGQMKDPDGKIVKQYTKVVLLVFEKSGTGGRSVQKIIDAYKEMSGGAQVMKTTSNISPEFFPSGP